MILLIGGIKGGVGKTTIATNLATALPNLILIDTDRQQSASYWCAIRDDKNLRRIISVQKFGKAIKHDIVSLHKSYENVLVDVGGQDSVELRNAMLVADKVLFPLRASNLDLWTVKMLDDLVTDALTINPNLESYVVINQAPTNPKVGEVSEAIEFLKDFPQLKLLKTVVHDRISYRHTSLNGTSVFEDFKDEKASIEMHELFKELGLENHE